MKLWRHLLCLLVLASVALAAAPTSGTASWYGKEAAGTMANGKEFNPQALTCASWDWPLGTWLVVSRADAPARSVMVLVTDRGPARRLHLKGRIVDLSERAFSQLAPTSQGILRVTVRQASFAQVMENGRWVP